MVLELGRGTELSPRQWQGSVLLGPAVQRSPGPPSNAQGLQNHLLWSLQGPLGLQLTVLGVHGVLRIKLFLVP